MDITIQILTKNNEDTISATIKSLEFLNAKLQIIDLGSTDNTLNLIKKYKIFETKETNRSKIRNQFKEEIKTKWFMYIHPWEALIKGQEEFLNLNKTCYQIRIFQENLLFKEPRIWLTKANYNFVNPIFETIKTNNEEKCSISLFSKGDKEDYFNDIKKWKETNPLSSDPFYYESCLLFRNQKYDEFLKVSDKIIFLDNKVKISTIMHRYYYSLVNLYHKKNAKLALQNLAICLSNNPLMAEFWCLAGDVYYFLSKFKEAIILYENAMVLGNNRNIDDAWPMDIGKYKEYPEKMIIKCKNLLWQNNY